MADRADTNTDDYSLRRKPIRHAATTFRSCCADLHVEMYDVLGMNEGDALADLPRKTDARFLRQHEVVADGTLEQLSAVHATRTQTHGRQLRGGTARTSHQNLEWGR